MNIDGAQDKGKEIAFFDAHAESDEYDVFTPQANEALIAAFVRLSGLPAEARVADLGCGSGAFTELLRRRGYEREPTTRHRAAARASAQAAGRSATAGCRRR